MKSTLKPRPITQMSEKTPPAADIFANHYMLNSAEQEEYWQKTPVSQAFSNDDFQKRTIDSTKNKEKTEKSKKIQDVINQAKNLTSPHYSSQRQLSAKNNQ